MTPDPGADNITNDIRPRAVYTCYDNTGHKLQGDIGKATGDELANTRRIYLSAHHLEVWSYDS